MIILLESNLETYSDKACEADLQLLPPQRYEKAITYRFPADRKRCVKAYMLLWEGLRREYGLTEPPVFTFGEHKKPFLAGHDNIQFSLSHTGNAVLCVLDREPVGADIEMIRMQKMEHLLTVFNDAEQEKIRLAEQPEICFTTLWTRKESFLKLTGDGLVGTRTLQQIPTDDTDSVHFESVIREAEGFVYSWCQWKPGALCE